MPANNTNIPQYTAADLLRYATGRMTAPEMHLLEKAALEDPFLAEALDGFKEAIPTASEISLQKQIDRLPPALPQKVQAKVVPLWRSKAVQIAIAAVLVLGGGWFIYSLVNKPVVNENVVALNKADEAPATLADSSTTAAALDSQIAAQPQINDSGFESLTLTKSAPVNTPERLSPVAAESNGAVSSTIASSPVTTANAEDTKDVSDSVSLKNTNEDFAMMRRQDTNQLAMQSMSKMMYKKEAAAKAKVNNVEAKQEFPYAFYGQITDIKNNPLPYANVMINGQELGTYSDVHGNFNFISQDSILSVRTRSLGYQSQNQVIKPGISQNKIVLQEDENLHNNLTVITSEREKRNASNQVKPLIVERDSIEGVEPAVGKIDYSLYLANNNRLIDLQQIGKQVQLKFELDKYGNATNIKVEKSSGEALDNEAIRLLKEGPKWKGKKGKKGKITVKF